MYSTNLLAQVYDLSWGYTSDEMLFQNFSLSIHQGDFIVLQGPSGSGKSTLVNMLTGYMPAPDKSLYYRHEDIAKMTTYEVQNYKREIGIVYQDNQLIPNLSVRDNIIYPLRLYGHDPDTIETVYEHIINLIGMRHRQYGLASQLSGGEQQKVALARALIHNPSFVIADEPTGNLDAKSTRAIADILLDIHADGNTIMLITHDQSLVEYLQGQQTNINLTSLT